jgi:RNase P subunit RPR2
MTQRRLTIPEVVEQFATYYEKNPAWGDLHVVLDDHNVEDAFVQCCLDDVYKSLRNEWNATHEQQMAWAQAHKLCRILLRLSKTQRLKLPTSVRRFLARRAQQGTFKWRHTPSKMGKTWSKGEVKITCSACGIGKRSTYSPELVFISADALSRALLRIAENAAYMLKYAGCPHIGMGFPPPPPF